MGATGEARKAVEVTAAVMGVPLAPAKVAEVRAAEVMGAAREAESAEVAEVRAVARAVVDVAVVEEA